LEKQRDTKIKLRVLCGYLIVLSPTSISVGRRVRHHLKISHVTPAAEQTGAVLAPVPVRAAEPDAPRAAAVAALTVDALPRAAQIGAPAAGLAANIAVAADCTAAQAVKAEAPTHHWSSALQARAVAHVLHVRDLHRGRDLRVRDRLRHPQAAAHQSSV
jgi:hypothetical protein